MSEKQAWTSQQTSPRSTTRYAPRSSSLPFRDSSQLQDSSIELLFDELDTDQTGSVSRQAIEDSLLAVYRRFAPTPKLYHLIHPSRSKDWAIYLNSLFPDNGKDTFNIEEFRYLAYIWNLPSVIESISPSPPPLDSTIAPSKANQREWWRAQGRLSRFIQEVRARCSTNLHRYIFVMVVLCLQVSLALWQFFIIFNDKAILAAFGAGVLIAKAASGALYPTLTLMVFSMSRWTQHFLRQSKYLRRFVDWEYAKNFHIKMACLAFLLGTIHSIAHLTGTYTHGLHHPQALAFQIETNNHVPVPRTYSDFMKWRASWTGLTALGFFIIMSLSSMPTFRRRHFEHFQWAHLLMYPLYAMLLVHGSSAILKQPVLGYWLCLPIFLVVTEKLYRFYRGFIPLEATVLLAEDNMVALSIKVRNKLSRFRPGQYVYLQIRAISILEWHPFTVSKITEDSIIIHIRTSAGNWTGALWKEAIRSLAEGKNLVAAMEGPYGSPSREFYRYNNTIIFGAGIGITPFSAILFDLFDKLNDNKSPWAGDVRSVQRNLKRNQLQQHQQQQQQHKRGPSDATFPPPVTATMEGEKRRGSKTSTHIIDDASQLHQLQAILQKRSISLHWTVKTSQDLQWLSLLLNQLSSDLSVKINIHLYVTQASKNESISTLIFRSLLDHHRVLSLQTTSVLTGLIQTCQFARPDLEGILDEYHRAYRCMDVASRPTKIGIIYCGPVSLGRVLSRKCQYLTSQARAESARLRYYYHSESF